MPEIYSGGKSNYMESQNLTQKWSSGYLRLDNKSFQNAGDMSLGSISYILEHINLSQSKSKPAGPQQEKPDQNTVMGCIKLFSQHGAHR